MPQVDLSQAVEGLESAAGTVGGFSALEVSDNVAVNVALLALALACWCVPQIRGRKPAVSLLGLAFVLILAGEMIGRGVFYGLHMTVGMAVAS